MLNVDGTASVTVAKMLTNISAAYAPEAWTEVRCIACVPCGFEASRLLFKVQGRSEDSGAAVQIPCPRCKSLISWRIGTSRIDIIKKGTYNHKRQSYQPE